jgi:hypothetical protein
VAELRRLFQRPEPALALRARPRKRGKFETQAKAQSTHQLRNIPSQSHSAAQSRLLERAGRERGVFCSKCTCVGWLTNHHLCVFQTTSSGYFLRSKMADWKAQIERVRQNDPALTELA